MNLNFKIALSPQSNSEQIQIQKYSKLGLIMILWRLWNTL